MKILSVLGARPQFIKAALLSAEFERRGWLDYVVHTGQHYDFEMSKVFFDQLDIKEPDAWLEVGSGSHALQTGEMMKRLEPIVQRESPDWTLVYGDTNTTLAGALVAAKLRAPLAHVEAGLRSFNRDMPEEINRLVTDHVADLNLAPTERAGAQLVREGLSNFEVVGDLMVDLVLKTAAMLEPEPHILRRLSLHKNAYALVTVHRASNTDDAAAFDRILNALTGLQWPVIFPVHPRTQPLVARQGPSGYPNITFCEPLSYFDMIALERYSRIIITDSGGIQKEAYALGVPCVTVREETEWTETLEDGWNVLAGTDAARIRECAHRPVPAQQPKQHYGDGRTAWRIADVLQRHRAGAGASLPSGEGLTASAVAAGLRA